MDANGKPYSGAKLYFYRAGTSSLVTVYQNPTGSTPHTNPVTADAAGVFPSIYLDTIYPLKAILRTAAGVTLQTIERFDPGPGGVTGNSYTVEAAADLPVPSNEFAEGIVLNDPDPAKNGYWFRDGGVWAFGKGFPDTFAKVALSGSGTSQAGVVNTGVNPASTEVFFAKVTTPNTGPLTLSISGGPVRQVTNLAGNPLSAGEWTGMVMFYLNDANQYQLLIDAGAATSAASSASAAGVQADRAEDEADRAAAAAAAAQAAGANEFAATRSALKALNTAAFGNVYLTESGRDGQFQFFSGDYSADVSNDPMEAITIAPNSDPAGASGVWKRLGNWRVTGLDVRWFGAKGDGVTDDAVEFDYANFLGSVLGVPVVVCNTGAPYLFNTNTDILNEFGSVKCSLFIRDRMKIFGIGKPTFKIKDGCSTDAAPINYNMFAGNGVYEDIVFSGIRFDMGGLNGANTISPDRYEFGKVTVFNGTPGIIVWAGNTLAANDRIIFSTTKTLPAEITAGVEYFVKTDFGDGSFTISETAGGANIDLSTAGTGTISAHTPGSYSPFHCAAIMISGIPADGYGSGVYARVDGMLIEDCEFINSPGVNCIVTGGGWQGFTEKSSDVRILHCNFDNNGLDSYDHSSIFLWANSSIVDGCHFDHPTVSQGVRGPVCAIESHGVGNRISGNYINNYLQGMWVCATSAGSVQGDIVSGNVLRVLWRGIMTWSVDPTDNGLEDFIMSGNSITLLNEELTNSRASMPKAGVAIISNSNPIGPVVIEGNTLTSFDAQGSVGVLAYAKDSDSAEIASISVRGGSINGFTHNIDIGGAGIGAGADGPIGIVSVQGVTVGVSTETPLYEGTMGISVGGNIGKVSIRGNPVGLGGGGDPTYGIVTHGDITILDIDGNPVNSSFLDVLDTAVCGSRSGAQATTFPDLAALVPRWASPPDGATALCSDGAERGASLSKYTLIGWRYAGITSGWLERREPTGN